MYYLLKVSPEELETIKNALNDAITYLDTNCNIINNLKNRKLYNNSYIFYKRYKKMIKEIEKKKDKNIIIES